MSHNQSAPSKLDLSAAGFDAPEKPVGVSAVPVGVGDDFPVQPIAGFLVVKAVLDKALSSRLVTREQRQRDFERAQQQIKSPMKGTVIAIGHGEDLDPNDRRRKPVPIKEGDAYFAIGDIVHFRPIGSYLLEIPGGEDDFYLLVGDREILAVEKKK